jgi:hypothetical protein
MPWLVLLCALCMPVVAWFSQHGAFGPDTGSISDSYPTLLVAAGYAFAIWGPIFLLDIVYAVWQCGNRRHDPVMLRVRIASLIAFALTSAWMVIFSQQQFWLALAVIWASLVCLIYAAYWLSRQRPASDALSFCAWLPLSLHAGWVSLAAFLNTAQVIVAFRLLPLDDMLPWSIGLLVLAALLLLIANARMGGNVIYALAAVWGLVAVYLKQSVSTLPGAQTAAFAAVAVAAVLVLQTLWLRIKARSI